MNIYKVLPDLTNERQMRLWYQGLRKQWSAEDINWKKALPNISKSCLDDLAKVLTPVLTGEQSALYSVSGLIPVLGHRSEVEGQFYLTTWAVDEARHTELFARYYHRLDREPLSIRRFPAGYLFQSRIISKEPAEWLTGVLVSETVAQTVSHEFKEADIDPVLSEICDGILEDEARHLGFNHVYMCDHFKELHETKGEEEAETFAAHLEERRKYVLEGVEPILDALKDELTSIGLDRERIMNTVSNVTKRRLEKSIVASRKATEGVKIKDEDLIVPVGK
ncbi:diiron oxygenase [Opitutia bacterium ISCC 51]|nr:diiron oxygenase [Opitutae bacterium ISCC 51]QXD30044.1 diiron oxygenase [Opitutae bacterium ISCC 52]